MTLQEYTRRLGLPRRVVFCGLASGGCAGAATAMVYLLPAAQAGPLAAPLALAAIAVPLMLLLTHRSD